MSHKFIRVMFWACFVCSALNVAQVFWSLANDINPLFPLALAVLNTYWAYHWWNRLESSPPQQ